MNMETVIVMVVLMVLGGREGCAKAVCGDVDEDLDFAHPGVRDIVVGDAIICPCARGCGVLLEGVAGVVGGV